VGMSAEVLEQACDPFFTTKELGQGTGLGLSMVYGFVTQSGGQLLIESTEGEGTTVRLRFPATAKPVEAQQKAPETVSTSPTPEKPTAVTILVVEDDEVLRELLKARLQALSYKPIVAHDSQTAFAALQEFDIDLLITDVALPGEMNGVVLASECQELQPGLATLYMSGYSLDLVSALANDSLPAESLLTKPFSSDTLADRIRSVLAAS